MTLRLRSKNTHSASLESAGTSQGAAMDAMMDRMVRLAVAEDAANGRRTWTAAEDQYVRDHLGWLTDAEMAEALGRTPVAVHLRWNLDLKLCGPSKAPEVITANRAAEALGIDAHKVAHWVDVGLIRGRFMAGGRNIRLIQRETFRRWALNPENWVYFDHRLVMDPELRRMMAKRARRWGDEWWTTRQVAEHHGVEVGDVKRYIQMGRIHSVRLPVSLGGRHAERKWSNHFVLKSEAVQVKFYHHGDDKSSLTPGGKAWIKKALRMGWNATWIGRSMGHDAPHTVLNWIKRYFPHVKMAKGRASWSLHPRKAVK